MNFLLFVFTLVVSFIAVRIGAIAFQLTGLEWSLAKFQALSCFTGTGFTTRESELVAANPQRRRIASALIILGHAGFVTLIATFANSLRTEDFMPHLTLPFLKDAIPQKYLLVVHVLFFVAVLFIIYKIALLLKIGKLFTDFLRANIVRQGLIKPVSFEELIVSTGGYGVSSIEVSKDSPILNKTLVASDLRRHDITVLAIERKHDTISNPPADTKILLGDRLICFGKLEHIRNELCLSIG